MKKSTTLFTLALFAILAFSSCEREQWGNAQKGSDDIDNRAEGQIGLSALKVSVERENNFHRYPYRNQYRQFHHPHLRYG